jgi:lysozyme
MSERGKTLIKQSEGLLLNSYRDTAGIWTVGYGHAATNIRDIRGLDRDGNFYEGPVIEGITITQAEANRLFDSDIGDFEVGVSRALTLPPGVELAACQFDALVDHAFQYGLSSLLGSTLLQRVNANPNNLGSDDAHGILWEFSRWNRVAGQPSEAIYRRACRRALAYAGKPILAALWRGGGIPWAVTNGSIDWSVTPTIYQVAKDAMAATGKPAFDPDFPRRPEPVAVQSPATEKGEAASPARETPPPLILTEPADEQPLREGSEAAAPVSHQPPSPAPAPVVFPTRPPEPPVPVIQQSIAVNGAENSRGWSSGVKPMIQSRRFWGLFLIMAGRGWMFYSGSNAVLSAVSDPIITEMFSGFAVMMVGEVVQWWGAKKATRPLT